MGSTWAQGLWAVSAVRIVTSINQLSNLLQELRRLIWRFWIAIWIEEKQEICHRDFQKCLWDPCWWRFLNQPKLSAFFKEITPGHLDKEKPEVNGFGHWWLYAFLLRGVPGLPLNDMRHQTPYWDLYQPKSFIVLTSVYCNVYQASVFENSGLKPIRWTIWPSGRHDRGNPYA